MNDIERRTLIGAAGIGALAALSKAGGGPLNPPAGAVASTGRTLDEVYNKIPAVGGSDGRTPVGAEAFNITAPGSYVLTDNLSAGNTVLSISANNVTLDLNGFSVTSLGSAVSALSIPGPLKNITIRNGAVDGGSWGIGATAGVGNVLIEDVRVTNAKNSGIFIGNSTSRGCVVRRCVVCDTGISTIAADGNLIVAGITLGGSSGRVEECVVSRLIYNGGGTGTFRGINYTNGAGIGNLVSRCSVSHDAAITGNGITFAGAGTYRDNTVMGFSTGYSGGTNGGGNV